MMVCDDSVNLHTFHLNSNTVVNQLHNIMNSIEILFHLKDCLQRGQLFLNLVHESKHFEWK